MEEITIKSIDDLIQEVRKLKSIYGKQPIWYRGQEKSEWHLRPSIQGGNCIKKRTMLQMIITFR